MTTLPDTDSNGSSQPQQLSFCGYLVALLALALLIMAGLVSLGSLLDWGIWDFIDSDAQFNIVQTYDEASMGSSGIGGVDSIENPWPN